MGGDPKKLFATGKACGWQSTKGFIHEMLYFNQFRRFSPTKVPKYSIDKVIVRVTTPTYHAHEPLGTQILARTLPKGDRLIQVSLYMVRHPVVVFPS